jgi:hypothetical protein
MRRAMHELQKPLLLAIVLCACQPLPEQPFGQPSSTLPDVLVEPEAALDEAPAVLRIRLSFAGPWRDRPEELLLVSGELSDYHVRRIKKRELPQTLVVRIVPALSWLDGSALVVAPSVSLVAGARYTLASPSFGRIVELRVASDPPALLSRFWPPADSGKGSERVLYCGQQQFELSETALWLDPGQIEASLHADPEGCLAISPRTRPEHGSRLIPPPLVSGLALEPSPIEHAQHAPPPEATCLEQESRFGPGCVRVEDDRAVVRSASEPMLWIAAGLDFTRIEPVAADGRWVLRQLTPSSQHPIALRVLDLSGRARVADVTLRTGAARPRLVINEVLANPLGPEPAQEWVEIVNDGSLAVNLSGWTFEDIGGASVLPDTMLAPGGYALLVREDFVEDDGLDIVPSAEATIVRLAQLGKNGLSNTGEPLSLRTPDGEVASRFPALPKPKAGISVARRRPWDLDDDPGAFVHHAAPGASPGTVNQTEPAAR